MKRSILAVVLLFSFRSLAAAASYFRPIDIHRPQMAAVTLLNVSDRALYGSLVDVALITHSTVDGTIIPAFLREYVPPAAWTPLQLGVGGSLSGNMLMHIGSSYNIGAALATSIIRIAGQSATPAGKGIAALFSDGLALGGAGTAGFYMGIGIAGMPVVDGHFQSLPAMFPGQGIGPLLQNASKYSLGLTFRCK